VEFEDGGGVFEVAALCAFGLDFAEVVQGLLELAGEPLVVHTEGGEGAVGVDDVNVGASEESNFERRDAVDTPGGVGEFLDELGLGGSVWLVFVAEAAAMGVVRGSVFGREAMAQRRLLVVGYGSARESGLSYGNLQFGCGMGGSRFCAPDGGCCWAGAGCAAMQLPARPKRRFVLTEECSGV
jgi:hypothetical protein